MNGLMSHWIKFLQLKGRCGSFLPGAGVDHTVNKIRRVAKQRKEKVLSISLYKPRRKGLTECEVQRMLAKQQIDHEGACIMTLGITEDLKGRYGELIRNIAHRFGAHVQGDCDFDNRIMSALGWSSPLGRFLDHNSRSSIPMQLSDRADDLGVPQRTPHYWDEAPSEAAQAMSAAVHRRQQTALGKKYGSELLRGRQLAPMSEASGGQQLCTGAHYAS